MTKTFGSGRFIQNSSTLPLAQNFGAYLRMIREKQRMNLKAKLKKERRQVDNTVIVIKRLYEKRRLKKIKMLLSYEE